MSINKVYISSTYRDLKEHRQQVIEFFAKKSIKENFDLISMEGYVADSNTPLTECLEDVEKCSLYILIIGNRYGYIPVDETVNPQHLSITELEYRKAVEDDDKTILAFFADESDSRFGADDDADEAVRNDKKSKLAAFKKSVRETRLTHPEPFISPYQLALQIAESLMRRSFIAYKLDESRKYCCDRVPQFSRFLQARSKGKFKAIIINGPRSELGLNLINRFSIFTLNLTENDVVPPLTFEEFLTSDNYEQCRTDLLVAIYYKLFNNWNLSDNSVPAFLAAIKTLTKPLVFVINSDAEMFEERQLEFLEKFIEELHTASLTTDCDDIYLFVNFEINKQESDLSEKIKKLQDVVNDSQSCISVLPPLASISPALIRNWLFSFVTPDQARVDELMDLCFADLQPPVSMRNAEKEIQQFIQKVNERDESVFNILN